jgi:hypothetical protein
MKNQIMNNMQSSQITSNADEDCPKFPQNKRIVKTPFHSKYSVNTPMKNEI